MNRHVLSWCAMCFFLLVGTPVVCQTTRDVQKFYEQGRELYQAGRYQEADEIFSQAAAILENSGVRSGADLGVLYAWLGDCSQMMGEHREALARYEKALPLVENMGQEVDAAMVRNKIGLMYEMLGQYDQALLYYSHALAVFQHHAHWEGFADVTANIGLLYEKQGRYEEAVDCLEQAAEVYGKAGRQGKAVEFLVTAGDVLVKIKRYDTALERYDRALSIAEETGLKYLTAIAAYRMGEAHFFSERYDRSMQYYRRSLSLIQELDMHSSDSALIIFAIGKVYSARERYQEAIERYLQALNLFEEAGALRDAASVISMLGDAYQALGNYDEARIQYQRCLQMNQDLGIHDVLPNIMNNIGELLRLDGRYGEALQLHREALVASGELGDLPEQASSLNNIGLVYLSTGQYARALDSLQRARAILQDLDRPRDYAAVLSNTGLVYDALCMHAGAERFHVQAIEIMERLGDAGPKMAKLLNNAAASASSREYVDALGIVEYYKRALSILRALGRTADVAGLLVNLGSTYHSLLNNYEAALDCYLEARPILEQLDAKPATAALLTNLGLLYEDTDRTEEALACYRLALKLSEESGTRENIWVAYQLLGYACWQADRRDEALTCYRKAVQVIEDIYNFTQGLGEEERSSLLGDKSYVYRDLIQLLLEMHHDDPGGGYDREAFTVSEKAKSRLFQDMMALSGAGTLLPGDERFQALVREERERIAELSTLRKALQAEYQRPREQREPEEIRNLQSRIAEAEGELRELLARIDQQYPRYAELKRPKALHASDVQNILRDGEVVLSYILLEERTAAFLIHGDSFDVLDIPVARRDIVERVRRFREGVTGIRTMQDLARFDWTNAYKLYRDLFEPAAEAVGEPRMLFICADDLLYTLPFEGLVIRRPDRSRFRELQHKASRGELPQGSEYGELEYFVDRYTTAYLPSVSMLRSLRTHAKPGYGEWEKPLVAFADPVFGLDDPLYQEAPAAAGQEVSRIQRDLMLRCTGASALTRLPQSGREAESVRLVVGGDAGDLYLRSRATEQHVLESGLDQARYVLFSTHGLLGGDFEGVLEPGLALCLVGNPSGSDGFLMMSEVLGLNLNAELVALSACNTSGEGDHAGNGEGFAGLTRAFMYAGGRSIVVSHWSVESGATRELIVETFEGLKAKGKADALREAKRSLKRKVRTDDDGSGSMSLAHPFFWAPFVLVGER